MGRSYGGEVTTVERRDRVGPVPFGQSDDSGVDDTKRKIEIAFGEFGDAFPVGIEHWLDNHLAPCDGSGERQFGVRSDAVTEQVADLRDDERWDKQWARSSGEQVHAARVILVPRRGGGVEHTRIDDQHLRGLARAPTALDRLTDELVDSLGDVGGSTGANREETQSTVLRWVRQEIFDGLPGHIGYGNAAASRLAPESGVDILRQHNRRRFTLQAYRITMRGRPIIVGS
jgi:hypothetical protein